MHVLELKLENGDVKSKEEPKTYGKLKQFLATICLGPIILGACIGWSSPVLPQFALTNNYSTPFRMTTAESSWVGSMLPLGALACSIPAGFVADWIGPKKCVLFFFVPTLLFSLIIIFSTDVYTFCLARFLAGCSLGGISVVGPVYISGISDVSMRGLLSSCYEVLIYVGITLMAILGTYMNYVALTISLGVLTAALGMIFVFLPESPTYLMKINERKRAEEALRFYRSKNFNAQEVLDVINENLASSNKLAVTPQKTPMRALLTKGTMKGLIASVGVAIFQKMTAVDSIIFYMVKIFQVADSALDAYTASIVTTAVELLCAFLFMGIVDRLGRKQFLYISAGGICFCLCIFGIYFTLREHGVSFYGMSYLPLVSMFGHNVAFALGMGPVAWVLTGELFDPQIKGLASGITIMSNWSFMFIVTKITPLMMENWGYHYTFFLYSILMAACIVFIKFCVPETKGKSLEQIQKELNR